MRSANDGREIEEDEAERTQRETKKRDPEKLYLPPITAREILDTIGD